MSPEVKVEDIEYIDYNESLREHSTKLREAGCDFVVAINHMRLPEDVRMAKENDVSIVDLEFGGHDHCYHRSLNPETNVFIQKSATDFECFTNLTILMGVQQAHFNTFKEQLAAKSKEIEKITAVVKPTEDVALFYSETLKRMFISERVHITPRFEKDAELDRHVQHYVK